MLWQHNSFPLAAWRDGLFGVQALSQRDKKIRDAQLSVLTKYGVLADFSGVSEAALDNAIKGGVASSAVQEMTFANWCDEVLEPGARVPVARFKSNDIPGQTRLGSVSVWQELARGLQAKERQLKASLREVKRLGAEFEKMQQTDSCRTTADTAMNGEPALRAWYVSTAARLQPILHAIREVEGAFFDYQGKYNRDYRSDLVQTIFNAMHSLDCLGFHIDVELWPTPPQEPPSPPIVLNRSQLARNEDDAGENVKVVVKGIPAEVAIAASDYFSRSDELPASDTDISFDWHVHVCPRQPLIYTKGELFHLSCFIRNLFEAMVRSGDRRPRGSLRESLILCLLLSRTAPSALPTSHARSLELRDTLESGLGVAASRKNRLGDSDASAGDIIQHLFQVLDSL